MKKKQAIVIVMILAALLAINVSSAKNTEISLDQPAPFPENI